jgi:hypothetical protein
VRYGTESFRHFQTARARTTFVLGEFPWEVRHGDVVEARDYVAPPRSLSAESTDEETTWSLGEYVKGAELWRAFELPGAPPAPRGTYANQPSPYAAKARSRWVLFGLFALLLTGAFVLRLRTARNAEVFSGEYAFDASGAGQAFVTRPFELPGRSGNVVIETDTDVENEWLFLDLALIDEASGRAYDFGREVSRYSGVDSDGEGWSEGSQRDRAKFGPVPGGRYYLRVEPSGETRPGRTVRYTLRVRRDVPSVAFYLIGLFVLLVPPMLGSMAAAGFESQRWAESDYAPASSGDDSGDDDE